MPNLFAQSTVEAEYIALSFASREALWLQKLELSVRGSATTISVAADTHGPLSLARNEADSERSKHIDTKFNFIQDHIAKGTALVRYVPFADMIADILTKSLRKQKHHLFLNLMGMKD